MNVLVIGATSGIGHSLYQHYVAEGHNVAIIGRRIDILEKLSASHPNQTLAFQVDISNLLSFNASFSEIVNTYEILDKVIVCAGVGELNEDLESSVELETISTNVLGWTNAVDAVLNYFLSKGKGHLVTITSVGGLQPTSVAPSYSASKAFQINYTKSLQAKVKKTPIVITEIRPGLVDTRMAKGEGLFWVMPLEKVTNQIIHAISKQKKLSIVTKRWRILNFVLKHFM